MKTLYPMDMEEFMMALALRVTKRLFLFKPHFVSDMETNHTIHNARIANQNQIKLIS